MKPFICTKYNIVIDDEVIKDISYLIPLTEKQMEREKKRLAEEMLVSDWYNIKMIEQIEEN